VKRFFRWEEIQLNFRERYLQVHKGDHPNEWLWQESEAIPEVMEPQVSLQQEKDAVDVEGEHIKDIIHNVISNDFIPHGILHEESHAVVADLIMIDPAAVGDLEIHAQPKAIDEVIMENELFAFICKDACY